MRRTCLCYLEGPIDLDGFHLVQLLSGFRRYDYLILLGNGHSLVMAASH